MVLLCTASRKPASLFTLINTSTGARLLLQTFLQRATNALLSPVVHSLGSRMVLASATRIAKEFKLDPLGPTKLFKSAKLFLVHSVPGFGPPRSLPPSVKACPRGCKWKRLYNTRC